MLFVMLLLLNVGLFSMDNRNGGLQIYVPHVPSGSQDSVAQSSSDLSEEDVLAFATSRFGMIGEHIRPHIGTAMNGSGDIESRDNSGLDTSPFAQEIPVRSERYESVFARANHERSAHEIIVRALGHAIDERDSHIKEKYSKKKVATIAAVAASIATIVTTICATLITLRSK